MIGRRTVDRVMTRRVKTVVMGSLAVALAGGVVLVYVLRNETFQTSPVLAEDSTPRAQVTEPAPSVLPETEATPGNAADALRAAERGRKLLERGNVKAAIAALTEASRVLPNDGAIAHLYGLALWRFGAHDRAIFELRRALLIARDNSVFRADLARALQEVGRHTEAAHLLQAGEGIGVSTLPPDPPMGVGGGLEPTTPAVDIGGAGRGQYAGKRSFTDDDLHGGRSAPVATPVPASPAPEPQP